jgi:hypothetical protein
MRHNPPESHISERHTFRPLSFLRWQHILLYNRVERVRFLIEYWVGIPIL